MARLLFCLLTISSLLLAPCSAESIADYATALVTESSSYHIESYLGMLGAREDNQSSDLYLITSQLDWSPENAVNSHAWTIYE